MGGGNSWGETETLTLYSQDYESATDASSWTNTDEITLSLATNNTKYISAVAGGSDRYCYTNFYESEDFYGTYTTYKLTFDAAITKPNNHGSQFVIMADGHSWPGSKGKNYFQLATSSSYAESANPHLLRINIPTSGTATIVGDTEESFTVDGSWLTFTLDVTTTKVTYSIVNRDTKASVASGTYTLAVGQSNKAKGLFSFLGRYANNGKLFVDNIKVTTEVEAGFIETPTAAITAVDGINRTVTFSCITDGVTLSYSTDGGSSFTDGTSLVISENTNIIVKATKGGKSVTSESQLFEAGTKIALNSPAASVSALTLKEDGLYYPTVAANYDPAGVLLAPAANLTAKFNGTTVSLPYVASTPGTLTITASYEGYDATEYNYNVVGYAKVLWQDYSTLTEMISVGNSSSVRKWSGNGHWELAEGYGLKAIRADGNAWVQINKAGMIAYDVLSEASASAEKSTIIMVNNRNTGNEDLQYFSNGKVLSKIYHFVEGRSVAVTSVGYATFCPSVNMSFAGVEGIEACTAAVSVDGKITYTPVSTVASGEGALLRTTSGGAITVGVPVKTDATEPNEGNAFVGITTEQKLAQTADGCTNYILANGASGVGFYKVNTNGSWVKAGTAYLKVAPSSAREFFSLDDETTGINAISNEQSTMNSVFDLQGRRVAQPQKGLYIVNGKKVVIK